MKSKSRVHVLGHTGASCCLELAIGAHVAWGSKKKVQVDLQVISNRNVAVRFGPVESSVRVPGNEVTTFLHVVPIESTPAATTTSHSMAGVQVSLHRTARVTQLCRRGAFVVHWLGKDNSQVNFLLCSAGATL